MKRRVFLIVQLWRTAILKPVGVQRHNVHHFKGLIVLYLDSRSSRAWQHFYLLPRPLEKAILLHKMDTVWFFVNTFVQVRRCKCLRAATVFLHQGIQSLRACNGSGHPMSLGIQCLRAYIVSGHTMPQGTQCLGASNVSGHTSSGLQMP